MSKLKKRFAALLVCLPLLAATVVIATPAHAYEIYDLGINEVTGRGLAFEIMDDGTHHGYWYDTCGNWGQLF